MQRIRQLSIRLGSVPALAYAAAYLLLILVFSLVFCALPPRHFQEAAALPRQPVESPASLLRDLREELRETYRVNGTTGLIINGWRMLPEKLDVGSLHTNLPLWFAFELVLPVNNGTAASPGTDAFIRASIIVYLDGRYVLSDTVFLPFVIQNVSAAPVAGVPTALPPPGMEITYELREIPTQIAAPGIVPATREQSVLPLSQGLFDRITAYGEASQGVAPVSTRIYERALYFSAGVATFGSRGGLVPLSPVASLLAFAEAVSALVLIALFANSLVYDLGEVLRGAPRAAQEPARAPAAPQKKQPAKRLLKRPKPGSGKASPWWARLWVKIAAGVLVLGLCAALLATLALLWVVAARLERRASQPVTILLPTQPPTQTPTPMPPATPTPFAFTPSPLPTFAVSSPTQPGLPRIEGNLLKNGGFEDGLAGWQYSENKNPDQFGGVHLFEVPGLNGRAFCSRRIEGRKEELQKELPAFVQELPIIDPTGSYFFSAWVRLNKAVSVLAMARMYDGSRDQGWGLAAPVIGRLPNGETTSGWTFIHGELRQLVPQTDRLVFGLWHGAVPGAPALLDSTVCVDDMVFGKIVK